MRELRSICLLRAVASAALTIIALAGIAVLTSVMADVAPATASPPTPAGEAAAAPPPMPASSDEQCKQPLQILHEEWEKMQAWDYQERTICGSSRKGTAAWGVADARLRSLGWQMACMFAGFQARYPDCSLASFPPGDHANAADICTGKAKPEEKAYGCGEGSAPATECEYFSQEIDLLQASVEEYVSLCEQLPRNSPDRAGLERASRSMQWQLACTTARAARQSCPRKTPIDPTACDKSPATYPGCGSSTK